MQLRLLPLLFILTGLGSCKQEKSAADILLSKSYEESSWVYNDRSEYIDLFVADRAISPVAAEKSEAVKKIRRAVAEAILGLRRDDREHSIESIKEGRKIMDSLSEFETDFTDLSLLEDLNDTLFQKAARNDFLRNEMNVLERYRSKYFMGIP